jgi:membrane fusion protein (multidrug efflux system)
MTKQIAFIGLTLLLIGCSSNEDKLAVNKGSGITTVEYHVLAAEKKPLSIEAPGTIMASETVAIYSEISGRIVSIPFKEGSYVKKNELLVQIDTELLQAQRQQLSVDLSLAQKDEARKKSLLENKAISEEIYEQAQSRLEQLKAQISSIDVQISKGQIRAPFSGKVGLRNISEGAYITPSEFITTLTDDGNVKVDFSIPQRYANNVKIGQDVMVYTTGDTTQHFFEIYATQPIINQETRMFGVRAVSKGSTQLIPGSFVNLRYNLGEIENALMAPTQSIVPVLNGQNVWKLSNGKAQQVAVELGIRTPDYIQLIGALNSGDTLITTGLLGLREGMAVTPKSN